MGDASLARHLRPQLSKGKAQAGLSVGDDHVRLRKRGEGIFPCPVIFPLGENKRNNIAALICDRQHAEVSVFAAKSKTVRQQARQRLLRHRRGGNVAQENIKTKMRRVAGNAQLFGNVFAPAPAKQPAHKRPVIFFLLRAGVFPRGRQPARGQNYRCFPAAVLPCLCIFRLHSGQRFLLILHLCLKRFKYDTPKCPSSPCHH